MGAAHIQGFKRNEGFQFRWLLLALILSAMALYTVVVSSTVVSLEIYQHTADGIHAYIAQAPRSISQRMASKKAYSQQQSTPRENEVSDAMVKLPANIPKHPTQQPALTWQNFWGSSLEEGVRSLQHLKRVLEFMRYQRLSKEVEDQATAGLDITLADAITRLSQKADLLEAQAWIRREVTSAVWKALHDLQHPDNCSTRRKLLCDLDKSCGFGCQVHHVVHCFTHAVALNRTMVLKVYPSKYITTPNGWDDVLAPVSSCGMQHLDSSKPESIQAGNNNFLDSHREVLVPIIDNGASRYDPPAMPQDVMKAAQLFTSRPEAWWVGILLSYIMRPSESSIQRLEEFRAVKQWSSPVVGVHVRRTDKIGSEAQFHDIEEYMKHVERYCDLSLGSGWQKQAEQDKTLKGRARGGNPVKCSMYLASDEPQVAAEILQKYKHIHVITNDEGLQSSSVSKRYTKEGFTGVYDDIMHLANADFLVGTFSSQVSRCAYEISLANNTAVTADHALSYHSVDSMWYYGGMISYQKCAAHDVTEAGVVKLKAGDRLSCPVIYEYLPNTGYMKCSATGTNSFVSVPPGAVVDCAEQNGESEAYKDILPMQMKKRTP